MDQAGPHAGEAGARLPLATSGRSLADYVLSREGFEWRPIANRPPMSERIPEAALSMSSPRNFVLDERFYVCRPALGRAIDQIARVIEEDLDSRRGQPGVGWARLPRLSWNDLVHEERGAAQMEAGDSAEVPEFASAKRRLVPVDSRAGVANDQHHRNQRPVGLAHRMQGQRITPGHSRAEP